MRHLSFLDHVICELDTAVRTLLVPKQRTARRPSPGQEFPERSLSAQEKQHIAGLMRVNHTGEVCAQALYQGQALTAKLTEVKVQMAEAAEEEVDHLAWCEQRLNELNSQVSLLNPLWYSGSLMLGMIAGLAGDRWSLGFVAETERQVTAHLEKHLGNLPAQDDKTKAILAQMQVDEAHHAQVARDAGALELPFWIKQLMSGVSKLMTKSSYYI
ncbi:2-polyprenyl-3-methyl-6-methoxy-1,4-benzoquinone monooxygenase [Legionella oakridgensis]|uniref:3-demethoxyubiquinol 3-hydroxylase n=2 Tax=Legionella oakridgensis TaxID=29423 RepID=W0BI93_9GAMM|nr:2-polyprenyl-3-methyl-6-methoxy-1,4-benzoquinone monooxygenase [Legionella oakridgensis]AHE68416.1 ubiquinone biosynthesis protein COQ7 [Legionella oakridgensis ATCC 33761 = DSM 21215]ETO92085.1 ubiquinone biosynthesis protein COQ7 [Legionella oakridgensis RV-2-2007]KTD38428.1 ubiquinone biosynthesis protein [Legionella oakridgensis]STY21355.1 ubiquinone biosynthesis protein [Legionella longbeachae]